MIAMPGRAAMLNRARLFGLPYTPVHHRGAGWKKKQTQSEKKDKIGQQLRIY